MKYKYIQSLSMKFFLLCASFLFLCKCVLIFVKVNVYGVRFHVNYDGFYPDKIILFTEQMSYLMESLVTPFAIIWAASTLCIVLREKDQE